MLLVVWGWVCAAAGSLVSLPQVARLLRARTSAGLSLLMWQLNTAVAIAWTLHGVHGGWANVIVPNALIFAASALVVAMIRADRRLAAARTWPLVAVVAAALAGVEYLATPALFGVAVLLPAAVGVLGQTADLIRQPNLSGISPAYVGASATVQLMWWLWGIGMGDTSVIICATVMGLLTTLNLVWLQLRLRGLVRPRVVATGP